MLADLVGELFLTNGSIFDESPKRSTLETKLTTEDSILQEDS